MKLYRFIIVNKLSILSFLTVGTLTAIINFSLFGILWKFVNFDYRIAVSIAYASAAIFNFIANRNFTFKSGHIRFYHQLPKYLSMVIINYLLMLSIAYMLVELIGLSSYVGGLVAISLTIIVGYLMSRYWVFTKTAQ